MNETLKISIAGTELEVKPGQEVSFNTKDRYVWVSYEGNWYTLPLDAKELKEALAK